MNKVQTSLLVAFVAGGLGFTLGKMTSKAPEKEVSVSGEGQPTVGHPASMTANPPVGTEDTARQVQQTSTSPSSVEPLTLASLKEEIEAIQSSGWMGMRGMRRASQLADRLAQSDLARLAVEVTSQPPGTDYMMGLHYVMNAYAEQDPEGAWRLAISLPLGPMRQAAMNAAASGIAGKDPKRAIELAESITNQQEQSQIRMMAVAQLAAKDPREALNLYRSGNMATGQRFDGTISMIFNQWARRDLEGAKAAALELTGQQQEQAMSSLLTSFTQTDPKAAWEYAKTLPESPQAYMDPKFRVVQMWANTDPQAALAAATSIENSSIRDVATSNVIAVWARVDFDAALDYALSVESPTLRSDVFRSLSSNSEGDREKLLSAVLDYMPPGNSFQQAVTQIFSSWSNDKPALAAEAVFKLPPGQILSNAASQVAQNWARTGQKTEVLAWVRKLPEGETRLNSIDAIFRQWAADDHTSAQNALSNISQAERERATRALAAGWSQKDPEAVLRWSRTLPSAEDRQQIVQEAISQWANIDPVNAARQVEQIPEAERGSAMQSVISRWASKDANSAGEWLRKQPAGKSRDSAISTLARTFSAEDPEAAIAWSAEITDEKNRERQIENHARAWLRNEPDVARAWISNSRLIAPASKEKLLK